MGNSLGCVKEPKEQAGEAGNTPLSPKRKTHFKRKRRGKKRTVPEGVDPVVEEPSKGAEDEAELDKFSTVLLQEEGEDLVKSLHQGTALYEEAHPNLEREVLEQGHFVQVREQFQGKLERAHLLTENLSSGSGTQRDLPEEGTTVIAHLLDNPAEQNREKAVSQLVACQRPGAGNSRAILVPLQKEPVAEDPKENAEKGTLVVCRSWEQPKLEPPATVADESHGAWNSDEGNESLSSATWGTLWTAERGTVSELSTPSPLLDQVETQVTQKSQWPQPLHEGRGGNGLWAKLPASQSKLSFNGSASSNFRCSSGYESDLTHQQATPCGMDGNRLSGIGDGPAASSIEAEGPKWRAMAKEKMKPAKGGVSASFFPPLVGAAVRLGKQDAS